MNRKIKEEESQKLFRFCEEHDTKYYDLQIELVDHLASAIEEQWETNPELPFKDALKNTYKKFGVLGFFKIKEQKQKELRRKYNQLHYDFVKSFYSWPTILFTVLTMMVVYTLVKQIHDRFIFQITNYVVQLVLLVTYLVLFLSKVLNIKVVNNKKFLLVDHLKNIKHSSLMVIMLPINIVIIFSSNIFPLNIYEIIIDNNWIVFIISFLFVNYYVALYSFSIYIPKKIIEHFMKYYSEFAQ